MSPRSAWLIVCAFLAGCELVRPSVEIHSFLLEPAWHAAPSNAALTTMRAPPRITDLRVEVAPAFEGKPLIYRLGDTRYEADYYNEFLATPRDALQQHAYELLRRHGLMQVYQANDKESAKLRAPPQRLTVQLQALYGDFRDAAQPSAVVRLRTLITEANAPAAAFEKEYEIRRRVADRSPGALVAGFNAVLGEALDAMRRDIAEHSTKGAGSGV